MATDGGGVLVTVPGDGEDQEPTQVWVSPEYLESLRNPEVSFEK